VKWRAAHRRLVRPAVAHRRWAGGAPITAKFVTPAIGPGVGVPQGNHMNAQRPAGPRLALDLLRFEAALIEN